MIMAPAGVQGTAPGSISPIDEEADIDRMKAVDVLPRIDGFENARGVDAPGSGSCTRMPLIALSALRDATSASSSASPVSAGSVCCTE